LAKFVFVLLTATAMLSSASIRYSVSRFLIRFLMGVALNGCRDFSAAQPTGLDPRGLCLALEISTKFAEGV